MTSMSASSLSTASIDTPKFTFAGLRTQAKCVKVYDGDTCWMVFAPYAHSSPRRFVCRMVGYNSAEMRADTAEEKSAAVVAKAELSRLLLGKICNIHVLGEDKYGRLLTEVSLPDVISVSARMISGGYGVPYTGRGDKKWTNAK